MKSKTLLILLITLTNVFATTDKLETLTTIEGKTYTEITILRHTASSLHFIHKSGVAVVLFKNLSKEIQEEYNYDPEKAAEYEKQKDIKDAKTRQVMAEERAEFEKRKAQRELEEKQIQTQKELTKEKEKTSTPTRRSGPLKMTAGTVSTSTKRGSWNDTWGVVDGTGATIVAEAGKQKVSRRVVGVHLTSQSGTAGGEYVVEMFWMGFPYNKKSKRYVCAAATKLISVPSGGVRSIAIASDYNYTDQSLLYLKSDSSLDSWEGLYVREWSGYTYAGWVVRVSDGNGRLIAQDGAQPSFIRHISQIPLPRKN